MKVHHKPPCFYEIPTFALVFFNQKVHSFLPSIFCCCLPLVKPNQKPEKKGHFMTQAVKVSCLEWRAKKKAENEE